MSDSKCDCNGTGYIEVKQIYKGSRPDRIGKTFSFKNICDCHIGKKIQDDLEKERLRDEKEREQRVIDEKKQRINYFISNGFGQIYINAIINDFHENERLFDLLKRIENGEWVYLHGESRSGKTHIAAAIARRICETKEVKIKIIKSVDLDILISNYTNDYRLRDIKDLAKTEILFIDDIGVGKLTQERHSMYYYIVDYRISNGLQTIFTSNLKTANLWSGSIEVDPIRIITRIQDASKGFEIKNREVL